MCGPALLMFMATVAALVLLCVLKTSCYSWTKLTVPSRRVLVTFSTPFIQQLYLLRSDAAGGVRFGVVGFCLELTGICTKQCVHSLHFDVYVH